MVTPQDPVAADLETYLTAAAVAAGDIPPEVAEYVAAGCHDDPIGGPFPGARWEIADDGAAVWAMARLAEAAAQLARIDALYLRKKVALDDWRDVAGGRHTRTATFMTGRLTGYALARRAADPKAKTLDLPDGKVTTRAPSKPWKVTVTDGPALLEWAVADGRDEYIRPALRPVSELPVEVVEKDGELRVFDPDGEVVPGLTAVPTELSATVAPVVPS